MYFFSFFFFIREPCEGKTFQKDTSNISYDVNLVPNTENQDLSILLSFYSHKELEKLKIELKFLEIFTSKELFVWDRVLFNF